MSPQFFRALRCLFLFAGIVGVLVNGPGRLGAKDGPLYILDTDLASDCDDAAAVAIANVLMRQGEVRVLAMMVSTGGPYGAPALSAINTWYGHPDIPVGTLKDPSFWSGGGLDKPAGSKNYESYTPALVKRFPTALKSGADAPDATDLYRRILAAQPDASVVINTIGPLINLARLMESTADAHSPLDGWALIQKKVKRLVVTGGKNPAGSSSNFSKSGAGIYTRTVLNGWPTPIVFVGNEVGGPVLTGWKRNAEANKGNPAREAYRLFHGGDVLKERASWDQAGILYAIRGEGALFELVEGGYQQVAEDGSTTWTAGEAPGRRHTYVRKRVGDAVLKDLFEGLMTQGRK
ncbi:MAG: nucleoside hydrolase [Opitutaceae bacterium]|nr:nucleoside hydrolase [Opitutaceae bacterium]